MKTNSLFLILILALLCSCSTDVILFTDYKDIPVVYGLMDANADTNFIRIGKAFGNDNDHPVSAFDAALVADSNNYPGKLDAFIMELKSDHGQPFQPTGRRFVLDTMTIHHKETGVFYAPHQKLYYTTERFNTDHGNEKYRYKLCVVKPDLDTVSAETSIVGGRIALVTVMAGFQMAPTTATSGLIFKPNDEAIVFELGMRFKYREVHPNQPEEKKSVSWSFGIRSLEGYECVSEGCYLLEYSPNVLFNYLRREIGNDTVWNANHPNVVRYIDGFEVFIAAAGEDYYNYSQFMQSAQNGLVLSSEYSNIDGGCGLFSSRILKTFKVGLSSSTKEDLFSAPWGFVEQ